MVTLASSAANANSHIVGDGGTRSDDNSLAASNSSGVDDNARATLQWLSLNGKSKGAGFDHFPGPESIALSGLAQVALCRYLCYWWTLGLGSTPISHPLLLSRHR